MTDLPITDTARPSDDLVAAFQIEREPVSGQSAERPVGGERIGETCPPPPLRRGGGLVEEPFHLRDRTGEVRRHG
jgi:hypothetical protein